MRTRVLLAAVFGFVVAFLFGFTNQSTPARAPSLTLSAAGVPQIYIHDPYVTGAVPGGIPNVSGKIVSCTQSQAVGVYDDGGSIGINCLNLTSAGGSSSQVQYNNDSGFGGITSVTSDGANLQYVALTSHPASPSADSTTLYSYETAATQPQTLFKIDSYMRLPMSAGSSVWAGSIFTAVGTTATWLAECHVCDVWFQGGGAAFQNIGGATVPTPTGTNAQIAWANTNWKTRQRLIGTVGASGNNQSAGYRLPTKTTWRGDATGAGGFVIWQRAYIASAANGQRFFAGLAAQTTALTAAADPDATPDTVYVGCNQGQSTLRVMSNDNSGNATETADLGSNFPCTTNGAGYDFWLAARPDDTSISYYVERLDTVVTPASGTITTDLPRNTLQLAPQVWINNGSDGGTTVARIDWGGLCMLNNW
jgi:hypothetical protein